MYALFSRAYFLNHLWLKNFKLRPGTLRHRLNLMPVSQNPCSGPQQTQQITRSAFQIYFQRDWQIDNGFFNRPIRVACILKWW